MTEPRSNERQLAELVAALLFEIAQQFGQHLRISSCASGVGFRCRRQQFLEKCVRGRERRWDRAMQEYQQILNTTR